MLKRFPASEQRPLSFGERLHNLAFLDPRGRPFSLYQDRIYGWPKAIILSESPEDARQELQDFARLHGAFGETETQVFAVTSASADKNAAAAAGLELPFPILSDRDGALGRAAGLDDRSGVVTLLFDSILRFERKIVGSEGKGQAENALAHARSRAALQAPSVVSVQAPVLAVPNVLHGEQCRRLIAFWEQGQKLDNSVAASDAQSNRANTKTKSRADVILPEATPEAQDLIEALKRRLLPEVLKGFGFRVSRMEHFRVGCYDSTSGGHFAPHRDNTTPLTKHRRYALTLNLNTGDYEGGLLRFPEFGPQLYAPPTGGAVVFHCSLLHYVLPVTRGRRFMVVGFFWGEEEHKLYEEVHGGRTLADSTPS